MRRILMLGDFNIPKFVENNIADSKTLAALFFFYICDLRQLNYIKRSLNKLLDLVASQMECKVSRNELPLVPENDHHLALLIEINNIATREKKIVSNIKSKTYNFKKAEFVMLYSSILETNWNCIESSSNINTALDIFYNEIYKIFDAYVPLYKNYSHNYPPWFDSTIIKNIKLKAKPKSKFKRYEKYVDLIEFKRRRRLIKEQISASYGKYMDAMQANISNNSNTLWSYIHSKN